MLIIFQAMDTAGKDSAIKHVMSGINPQGCEVHSFKRPSEEDYDHDFLWRSSKQLPERGRIGIFNRSYYEEVLVVRVHKDALQREKLPADLIDGDIWKRRFKDIRAHEKYLARNGTRLVKFYLHLSKAEQSGDCLNASTHLPRTGSFLWVTSSSAGYGTNTWLPTNT